MRRKAMPLGEALARYLREEGLETPLLEYRAAQAWPQVMGPAVARYTRSVEARDGVLTVRLRSSALRQNLMMMRSDIARRLNSRLGGEVVREVRLL